MAIVVIAVGIIGVRLSTFFRGRLLNEEARRLLSLTQYAQSRAVSEGMPTILWIDETGRRYGLQTQPGYLDHDEKAVTYELGKDLEIEVDRLFGPAVQRNQSFVQGLPESVRRIRFEPGGSIALNNPETIVIRDAERRSVLITPDHNRMNYAIQTNNILAFRG